MQTQLLALVLPALLVVVIAIVVMKILSLRRIVPTNVVHIVQQGKRTISYGVGKESNVYYKWPTWLPLLGVEVRELPVSNFDIDLHEYEAYDKDRLPFRVDVKAFFRIKDTNKAAEKVESFGELKEQLTNVVKGSVRSILAKEGLDHIMEDRATFGIKFTESVNKDLDNWGVEAIKSIELMDIRDAKESHVINQIMAKKMSAISAESRMEVAKNNKNAQEAELEATKQINLKVAKTNQESEEAAAASNQAIGIAKAKSEQESGIANQKSKAAVAEESQKTAEKEMQVLRTQQVRKAEIDKEAGLILADQNKQTAEINAQANKTIIETNAEASFSAKKKEAEGNLILKQREADGIKATGLADAEVIQAKGESSAKAKELDQLASVTAQTTLAKEIGKDDGYQKYLLEVKRIEVSEVVGVAQANATATALSKAKLSLLVNSGDVHSGLGKFSDIFTSKGASQVNGILESLAQTEGGEKLVDQLKKFLGVGAEKK